MKKILKEIKEFATKSEMADVAIGIVIGAALSDVVNTFVSEILLPPISFITAGANLENRVFVLREATSLDGVIPFEDIVIGYGKMIEVSIHFLVIAFVIFMIIKSMNVLREKLFRLTKEERLSHNKKSELLLEKTVALLEKQNDILEKNKASNKENKNK